MIVIEPFRCYKKYSRVLVSSVYLFMGMVVEYVASLEIKTTEDPAMMPHLK